MELDFKGEILLPTKIFPFSFLCNEIAFFDITILHNDDELTDRKI